MLRVDNRAQIVRLPWTFASLFSGRYAVQSGNKVFARRWKKGAMDAIAATQQTTPVPLVQDGRRTLWYFLDRFYWDDDDLGADDIKALVLQRRRRLQQKVQTARSLLSAEAAGRPARAPIPSELPRRIRARWRPLRGVRLELRPAVRPRASRRPGRRDDVEEPATALRRVQPAQERHALGRRA